MRPKIWRIRRTSEQFELNSIMAIVHVFSIDDERVRRFLLNAVIFRELLIKSDNILNSFLFSSSLAQLIWIEPRAKQIAAAFLLSGNSTLASLEVAYRNTLYDYRLISAVMDSCFVRGCDITQKLVRLEVE